MLAILYDVHGNLPALEAVLADARGRGAERWLLGGDVAAFGAWPAETVLRLQELDSALWIRGNWECWLARPDEAPADNDVVQGAAAHCRAALGAETVARLGGLPTEASQHGTLFVHASPGSDMEWVPQEPDAERDEELLRGVAEHRLVFGHTHVQFSRRVGDVELVNPGSVGLPWDGDTRAAYALLEDGAGVELRRVEYDVERAGAALDAIGEAWARVTAERLRRATFSV